MSGPAVTCVICEGTFGNDDDICSTNCGHVYHVHCLRTWLDRNYRCPLCQREKLRYYPLYLKFEENYPDDYPDNYSDNYPDETEEIREFKAKLESAEEKIAYLTAELAIKDENFLELQKQYTSLEVEKCKIKLKVNELENSEKNFLDLQKQYTEKSETLQDLQDHVQLLTIDHASFKNDLENGENNECDISVKHRITLLEKNLQVLTAELEKEVANNTQLSIEKMKLQCLLDRYQLNDKNCNTNSQNPNPNESKNVHQNNSTKSTSEEKEQMPSSFQDGNNFHKISILIKNFPSSEITHPLENIVINLASKMKLSISKDDLFKVNIVESNEQHTSKVTLLVQFKKIRLRNKFFLNKKLLKNDPTADFLIIKECIYEEVNSLFLYAKQKLKSIGLNCVYYKKNQVFAKSRHNNKIIKIKSKSQVDDLINTVGSALDEAASSISSINADEPHSDETASLTSLDTNRPDEKSINSNGSTLDEAASLIILNENHIYEKPINANESTFYEKGNIKPLRNICSSPNRVNNFFYLEDDF